MTPSLPSPKSLMFYTMSCPPAFRLSVRPAPLSVCLQGAGGPCPIAAGTAFQGLWGPLCGRTRVLVPSPQPGGGGGPG